MPPNHNRPTSARRIALITSAGVASVLAMPSMARTSSESRIDFALRGYTPPPREISALS
jgi:hypothetical protein